MTFSKFRILRRSWVLLIQSNDKSQISYLIDKLGLKDTIKVKSEIDNIQRDAIGPFLDKQIALDLQTKIKKITSLNITIQEIVEK